MDDIEIRGSLSKTLESIGKEEREKMLEILYQPQDKFKVKAVTRCSSSIPGVTIVCMIAVVFYHIRVFEIFSRGWRFD